MSSSIIRTSKCLPQKHRIAQTFGCVLVMLALFACRDSDKSRTNNSQKNSAGDSGTTVRLFVGDAHQRTMRASEIAGRPAVSELFPTVPYASWQAVVARGPGKAKLVLHKPAINYATKTLRLYLNKDGQPSLGLFQNNDRNGTATLGLRTVLKVVVHTKPLPKSKPVAPKLRFAVNGNVQIVEPAHLDSLEKRHGKKGRTLGWTLVTVIGHYVKIDQVASLVVTNAKGVRHGISTAQLANTDRPIILKRNRRGHFHLRATPEPGQRRGKGILRNVVRIEASTSVKPSPTDAATGSGAVVSDDRCAKAKRSPGTGKRTSIEVWNALDGPIRVFWLDFKGALSPRGEIPPLAAYVSQSVEGHVFRLKLPDGRMVSACASSAKHVFVVKPDGRLWASSRADAQEALTRARDTRYVRTLVGRTPIWVHKTLARSGPGLLARAIVLVKESARLMGGQFNQIARVPVWLEPTYPHDGGDARYHPLVTGARAKLPTSPKTNSIEVVNVSRFFKDSRSGMPFGVLHEYVHVLHYHLAPSLQAEIRKHYQAAIKGGKYNSVRHGRQTGLKAYALNTEYEYFAEISEAYLATNDWFPFWREQLKSHDPGGYALARKVWGNTKYRAYLAVKPCTANASSASGTAFTSIVWTNKGSTAVKLAWIDSRGRPKPSGTLAPGKSLTIETFAGHTFSISRGGKCVSHYTATRAPSAVMMK